MKRRKISLRDVTVDRLYFGLSVFLIIAAFLSIAISKGKNFEYLFWHGATLGIYPDLFESVIHARTRNPYELEAIYPAFAYCLIYFFNFFIPGKYKDNFDDLQAICDNTETLVIAHIFYAVMILAIAYFVIKTFGKEKYIGKYLLVMVFITSSPFIFLIERGNTVIITVIFLFIYLLYYNSENKILRELAIICLACAAAMKLYPAVFGVLLLADRKYKEAARTIIYGIVLFVVPFVFMGGIGQIPVMLKNSLTLNNDTLSGSTGFGYGFKVNATSSLGSIMDWMFGKSYTVYIKMLVYFFVGLLLFASLFIKTNWKRVAALSIVVILMPDFSFIYNVIYLLVPLCFFIKESRGKKLDFWNVVYTLCFVGAFAPLPYGEIFRSIGGYNNMNWGTIVSSFSLILLGVIISVQGLYICIKENKRIITVGVLVCSLVLGVVPYVLSKQSDLPLLNDEKIWATSEQDKAKLDELFDYMNEDLEKDEKILCFPKVNSLLTLEGRDDVYYYTNVENKNSINKPRMFEKVMPQFVVVDLTNYAHYQDKIIREEDADETLDDTKRTITTDEYDTITNMQGDVIDFLNDNEYCVVKYFVTENHRYIALWEREKYAQDTDFWNNGGTGTRENPYQISNYEQLCLFSDVTNCGAKFTEKYIALTNDIDASSEEVFTPISKHEGVSLFEGVFDGNGHTISHLNLAYKYKKATSNFSNTSFINNLDGAIINLCISDSVYKGTSCAVFTRSGSNTAIIANCISRNNMIDAKLRAAAIADKYSAVVANCIAMNNTIKGGKNCGFIGLKYSNTSVTNSFTTDTDPSNYAAGVTADLINTENMAKSMNRSVNTFVEGQKDYNAGQKKEQNKKKIYDYCKWIFENNEIGLAVK